MRDIKCQRCDLKEAEYVHTTATGEVFIFCKNCYARYLAEEEEKIEKAKKEEEKFWANSKTISSEDGIRSFCYKKAYKNHHNVKYRLSFMKNNKELCHIWQNTSKNIALYRKRWLNLGKLPNYNLRNEVWISMVKAKQRRQQEEKEEQNEKD